MGSRQIVPQQTRGAAVAGENVHQKKVVFEARNRRALCDIGNLVPVGAADPKHPPSRPITRSFGAQLLANAQNKAAEESKKQVYANAVEKKPLKEKKAVKIGVAKPKVEDVVDISSDSREELRVARKVEEKRECPERSKKTLSSVLSARSKVACGITVKPDEEETVDIDAKDAKNHLAGVEYVEDLYKFYKSSEGESRPRDYMDSQPDINQKMREILIDWLVDVHHNFDLAPETLYLTVNIIDRFLSAKIVPRRELQLLGIGATIIASKYEEIWPPEVGDLVRISDNAYTREQILMMEKTILAKLEWNFTVPTHYVFLARFIKASISDIKMENMAFFLAELGMTHYDVVVKFSPSMVAASAVYAARCTLNITPFWTPTLKHHADVSESQLKGCAGLLVYFHAKAVDNKLQSVFRKYSNPLRDGVALIPPAKILLAASSLSH